MPFHDVPLHFAVISRYTEPFRDTLPRIRDTFTRVATQGSVATRLRCGEIFYNSITGNLLLSLLVKEL